MRLKFEEKTPLRFSMFCQVKAWISSRHDLTDTGNTGCSANCPRVRDNTEELVDRGNKPSDQNTRTRMGPHAIEIRDGERKDNSYQWNCFYVALVISDSFV